MCPIWRYLYTKKLCKPFQLSIFIVRLAQVAHITESIHKSHIALLCSNWFISLTNDVWMVFKLVSVSNDAWFCQNRIAIAYISMLTLYVSMIYEILQHLRARLQNNLIVFVLHIIHLDISCTISSIKLFFVLRLKSYKPLSTIYAVEVRSKRIHNQAYKFGSSMYL